MVLVLLSFRSNHDTMILKLHKKIATLNEGWLFIGRFKHGSVPGMINKVLAQFTYKPA